MSSCKGNGKSVRAWRSPEEDPGEHRALITYIYIYMYILCIHIYIQIYICTGICIHIYLYTHNNCLF